ncbi:unnamed protein product [Linum tenue]|uniref:Uncharacterized protein n=1 Tax=Linum tenue TaxID=586396 RepID=A0AAV0ITF3_9ROSI|nr:unnamed protein product [Linum tenue]
MRLSLSSKTFPTSIVSTGLNHLTQFCRYW